MAKKSIIEPQGELISINEAAKRMGISREAIYSYAKRGLITLHKRSIGKPRTFVDWHEIEQLLAPRKTVNIQPQEYPRRLQEALRLAEELDPVIEAGTRRPVDATEDLQALRKERVRQIAGE